MLAVMVLERSFSTVNERHSKQTSCSRPFVAVYISSPVFLSAYRDTGNARGVETPSN